MYAGRARSWALAPLACATFVLALAAPSLATIHAGDTLFVKVYNHPELSKQVTVDSNGGVRVPLSGVVNVGGLAETAAAKQVADALRPYVVYPAVSIETISQGSTLFVSGGPGGILKYQPGETLSAAIADVMQTGTQSPQTLNDAGQSLTKVNNAGDALRSRIDLHSVGVQRDGKMIGPFDTVALAAKGDPGPVLQPGDTIAFAYKAIDVRVLGDVAQPGTTYLSPEQTLSEAISQAGGLLPTSATNHVLLERDGATRSLALGDPAFSSAPKRGDVITVPRAPRVNVIGTVATPGVVALKSDATLLSALYTAGGPTKSANLKYVEVVRGDNTTRYDVTQLTHGDVSQNPMLQDGDTVVVPEGHKFDFTAVINILGGIAAGLATRVPL